MVAESRNLGMVMGLAIASAIFNITFHLMSGMDFINQYRPELENAFMHAFRYALISGAVSAFSGMLIASFRGAHEKKESNSI